MTAERAGDDRPAGDHVVDDVAHLLARRVGMRLDPAIRSRLARAVREEAERYTGGLARYVARLESDPESLQELLNRVTVQETSFFRDPGQFAALASTVLPALASTGLAIRIWSAGCANGQEAYSLAMILAESGIADWRVVASDISTNALRRTEQACYTERELSGLSPNRRARHLVRRDPAAVTLSDRGERLEWEITPALRSRVEVLRHNLAADPFPLPSGTCQVVLCRNVLIYFGRDDVVRLLDRLSDWMPEAAYLLLGYSESLWQVSDRFELERVDGAFVYTNLPVDQRGTPAGLASPAASPEGARPPRLPAAAVPPRSPAGPPTATDPVPTATAALGASELLAEGEAAMGHDRPDLAIRAFRQAVYLDPDHPLAHFHLALAFEASGDPDEAGRAYSAARAALARCRVPELEAMLEGYDHGELVRLLDDRARP